MKRNIISLVVFTSMFVPGVLPKAQAGNDKGCTNSTLKGDYLFKVLSFSRSDQPDPMHPTVVVGVRTFDGEGNISQVFTANQGGQVANRAVSTGTYTLASDCTGAMAIRGSDGVVRNWDIFVAQDGSEGVATNSGTGGVASAISLHTFKKP